MPDREPILPREATDKLVRQFNIEGGMFIEQEAAGKSPFELASAITELAATTFTQCLDTSSAEFEYLSLWHRSVRGDCSDRYRQLAEEDPGAKKVTIREDRELQILNGVRRGVSRAMLAKHREAEKARKASY